MAVVVTVAVALVLVVINGLVISLREGGALSGWARLDCTNKQPQNLSGLKTGVSLSHRLLRLHV